MRAELNNDSSDISEEEIEDTEVGFIDKVTEEGDFVLVGIDPVKGSKVYYVGKLISNLDEDEEFQISYLRKSQKFDTNSFKFPQIKDEATIGKETVIGVLPNPVQQSNKRM